MSEYVPLTDEEIEKVLEDTNQACIEKYGKTFTQLIEEGDEGD